MITNEYQYKISRSRVQKFQSLIAELSNSQDADPILINMQIKAIQSQINDIKEEISDYIEIKENKIIPVKDLMNFKNLPTSLIKARIGLNMTQKEFAELIGVREQQIQRWESTEYATVSISRVYEIISAILETMNISLERVLPPNKIFKKLEDIGIDKDFVINRFSPLIQKAKRELTIADINSFSNLSQVYNWKLGDIISSKPLELTNVPEAVVYKLPRRRNQKKVHAYTIYAHYLALLVDRITSDVPIQKIPDDAYEIHHKIIKNYGKLTLENCVDFVWQLGIPTIALDDPGVFNGACFHTGKRFVIILKQKTRYEARWMFDLFHEFSHVISGQDTIHISSDPLEYLNNDENKASDFSSGVLLGKNPQKLAEKCISRAKRKIYLLKDAIIHVAMEEGVRIDALANYLAYRLHNKYPEIWGIAQNLQIELDQGPILIFKKKLLKHSNLEKIAQPEFDILQKALI